MAILTPNQRIENQQISNTDKPDYSNLISSFQKIKKELEHLLPEYQKSGWDLRIFDRGLQPNLEERKNDKPTLQLYLLKPEDPEYFAATSPNIRLEAIDPKTLSVHSKFNFGFLEPVETENLDLQENQDIKALLENHINRFIQESTKV